MTSAICQSKGLNNVRLVCCLVALVGSLAFTASLASSKSQPKTEVSFSAGQVELQPVMFASLAKHQRVLNQPRAVGSNDNSDDNSTCAPRTVEAYPPDLFTLAQKQRGAILIHAFASVWLFVALAVVCNDYFVASLEVVCESLHLKPDVAGATFMAAGSSAPELLAAVVGVFIAQSDVGVSTIVGSAIFNNLMIVSLCGLAATGIVYLSWWPLFRDCGFYCLSVAALIAVIHDGLVTWYESVLQLALFAIYIVVMVLNDRIDAAISSRYPRLGTGGAKQFYGANSTDQDLNPVVDGMDETDGVSLEETGKKATRVEIWTVQSDRDAQAGSGGMRDEPSVTLTNEGPPSPFQPPLGCWRRVYWLFSLPWATAFHFTIPDCRKPGIWRRLFVLTFLVSVLWISGLIYMLVWMVCAVGDAMGIPDTVMGLTLLSIGTCIPDAMAGIFVAKGGLADMAIANSIASNVFDITACLGLPWFISTALLKPGSTVVISSSGLTYTSITLLSTVIFLLVAVHLNRMRIDKKIGFVFLAVYLVVVTFACLYETNVFGPLNPEPCPRQRL